MAVGGQGFFSVRNSYSFPNHCDHKVADGPEGNPRVGPSHPSEKMVFDEKSEVKESGLDRGPQLMLTNCPVTESQISKSCLLEHCWFLAQSSGFAQSSLSSQHMAVCSRDVSLGGSQQRSLGRDEGKTRHGLG